MDDTDDSTWWRYGLTADDALDVQKYAQIKLCDLESAPNPPRVTLDSAQIGHKIRKSVPNLGADGGFGRHRILRISDVNLENLRQNQEHMKASADIVFCANLA